MLSDTPKHDPGARRLGPGDLKGSLPQEKHDEIINRVKYLVHDQLEEPPHIQRAREILTQRGTSWRDASDTEIFSIIDQLPKPLFHSKFWTRGPQPPPSSDYHDLMSRIHKTELDFYGFDGQSRGGEFLNMLRDAKLDPDPSSFYPRLKQAGITINKVVHFTRRTATGGDVQLLSLPYKIEKRRELFVGDLAWFLGKMHGWSGGLPHATYDMPPKEDRSIEEGLMKVNGHTFVFDTTLNNSVLQAILEADFKPAVIMKEFTFWHDGADEDAEALGRAGWAEYSTTHWLTEHYDVFRRHPGSGFVTCNPTIYIRKGESLMHALKRSASNLVSRSRSKAG